MRTPRPPARAGSFRDKIRAGELEKINISEQIAVRQDPQAQSHTAGFEVCVLAAAAACPIAPPGTTLRSAQIAAVP